MDVSQLEPADRDPVKLRNTALILVAIMIIGGTLIFTAYRKYTQALPFSPSILDRFSEFETIKLHESELGSQHITAFWGKVWVAAAVSRKEPEKSELNLKILHEVLEEFPEEERPPLMLFFIDAKPEEAADLKGLYPQFGSSEQCWRVAANDELVRDTLKKGLKIEVHIPKDESEAIYTQAGIAIVDKNRHLRGWKLDNDFDFQVVAKMEADYQEALKSHPADKLNKPPVSMEQMRELFKKSIQVLNDEKLK